MDRKPSLSGLEAILMHMMENHVATVAEMVAEMVAETVAEEETAEGVDLREKRRRRL